MKTAYRLPLPLDFTRIVLYWEGPISWLFWQHYPRLAMFALSACASANLQCTEQEESIRIGCVAPTCQMYMCWSPLGVSSRGMGIHPLDIPIPWKVPGTRDTHLPLSGKDMEPGISTYPLWTKWQTDTCENITFPQLLLRAVITMTIDHIHTHCSGIHDRCTIKVLM